MTPGMSCKNVFGAKAKNLPLSLHAAVSVMPQARVCGWCQGNGHRNTVQWGGSGRRVGLVMPRSGEPQISYSYPLTHLCNI